ncbi:magnesium transporter [Candidatus Poribacteria bacterium]|nr:magnesium transporter [Candidatus Poribacteria bacterium]
MITIHNRTEILISTALKLLERRAIPNLKKVIDKTHAADIALLFPHVDAKEKRVLFDLLIETKRMGEVLSELNRDERNLFIQTTEPVTVAEVLHSMPPDDVTDLLAALPQDKQEELINLIKGKASVDLGQLLQHGEETAGYMMTPNFFALPEMTTAAAAIERIQNLADVEMVFYVYVIDDENQLKGVISLRQLVTTRPNTPLRDVMTKQVYVVHTNTPREEVAQVIARYNVLAVPVLDESNHLAGIVTIDDVIDVIREENTEDMLKMGGLEAIDTPYIKTSFLTLIKKRARWLVFLFLGEMLTATAMGYFEKEIARAVVLALFVPLIISSGGNSGSQAATLIIRAMAVGEIRLRDWWRVMRREVFSGLTLGAILGSIGFFRIAIWESFFHLYGVHWALVALTVAFSLVGVVLWGTLSGSMLPFLLRRLGADPAASSAPFVATLVDVTGLVIYFSVAAIILRGTLL